MMAEDEGASRAAADAEVRRPGERRGGLSRRALLRGAAALPVASLLGANPAGASGVLGRRSRHVVVVGAGAFGGWTALWLARSGVRVTLIDAWGPGNSRSSSGGETRVIRGVYGSERIYVEMVAESFRHWRDIDRRRDEPLLVPTGSIWMVTGDDDAYLRDAIPLLEEYELSHEELGPEDARDRWPQVEFEDVRWVLHESGAGYLAARRACQAVFREFLETDGEFVRAAVEPAEPRGGRMGEVRLSGGRRLGADAFVFACGPWLGKLFPEVLGERIRPTRQEVFYFGPPAGDARYTDDELPVWVEWGSTLWYGVPGNRWRGFKVADDTRGPVVDPTSMDRIATREGRRAARAYMERRFPGMAGAPLVESRVCQYENSPDHDLIVDRHPGADDLWIVGGGSGHGFKMSPAVGRLAADLVRGDRQAVPDFSLDRFDGGS